MKRLLNKIIKYLFFREIRVKFKMSKIVEKIKNANNIIDKNAEKKSLENAKKNTGSFYTPRDVVDYMVDTSLFQYLKKETIERFKQMLEKV